MQRLGGLDSAFLYFETPTMHMHVGGLMLVDPSTMSTPYSYAALRSYIESRLPLVPAFRRKLATVPLNLSKPYWVEDQDFDLDYHLSRIAVPPPGGDRETADVVAGGRREARRRRRGDSQKADGPQPSAVADVRRRGPRGRAHRHCQQGAPQ